MVTVCVLLARLRNALEGTATHVHGRPKPGSAHVTELQLGSLSRSLHVFEYYMKHSLSKIHTVWIFKIAQHDMAISIQGVALTLRAISRHCDVDSR